MGETQKQTAGPTPEGVTPLLAPLRALQSLLEKFDNQGVLVGGVAASLLGRPRYTVDVDAVFLLGLDDVPQLLKEAATLEIEPRVENPLEFARRTRVVLLRHTPSGTDIDISLGVLPFEIEMVQQGTLTTVSSLQLRLPTPEDLIITKAVAHRPKDLIDIQTIAQSHPNLNRERVKFWVEQFGDALDLPELWRDIEKLL